MKSTNNLLEKLITQRIKPNSSIPITDEENQQLVTELKTYPYIVDKENNYIGLISKDKYTYKIQYIMSYCTILRKIIDEDSNQIKIIYELNNGIDIVQILLDGDSLSKFGLKTLLSFGVRFSEKNNDKVIDYLLYSDMNAEVIYGYSKLGWTKIGKDSVFKYNRLISNAELGNKYIYQGSLDLNSKGSLSEWVKMVNDEVCGNIPMTFLLMASFASPLLSILNESHDFGSILFCLCNGSSRGKSTTAILCASVFTSPVLNKGVAVSFNGTENALQEFLSQINGLCVVFDELGVSTISNLERVLYSFCLGRSKMRLNGDASLQGVKKFSSIIFTTSEISFIHEKSMDGIKTRVFQIEDTLTKNAENSDNIKRISMQNYGVAGTKYLELLVKKGQSVIETDYLKYKEHLFDKYKEIEEKWFSENIYKMSETDLTQYQQSKRLTNRILSKLAIVIQATAYVKELFDFNIEETDIIRYVLHINNTIESTQTPEDELLTVVYEDILKNTKKYRMGYHFISKVFGRRTAEDMNFDVFNFGCVGLIRLGSNSKYYEICIAKNYFEQMMKNNGIADFRKRLKNLRSAGILVAEKDRLISREKIIDILDSKVYILRYYVKDKIEAIPDKCIETHFKEIEQLEDYNHKVVDINDDVEAPSLDLE